MAKIIHNDTVDVLLERVSIRAFKDEAIGLHVLNTIEQAAQNTASSQYLNDWSAIRIKDPAVKTEIARICNQDYIANAPVLYIFVLDQYRNSLIAQSEGVAVDSDEFTLKNSYRFSQAQNDAVLALHAMETAAESFELGTVILGSILGNIPELVKLLALPKYTYPVLGLALGKPDQHPDPKPRLPRDIQFFDDSYNAEPNRILDGIREYDREVQAYYDTRGTVHGSFRILCRLGSSFRSITRKLPCNAPFSTASAVDHTEDSVNRAARKSSHGRLSTVCDWAKEPSDTAQSVDIAKSADFSDDGA